MCCVWICRCVCAYVYVCVRTCVCMFVHVYHVHVYTCLYVCTCVCMCIAFLQLHTSLITLDETVSRLWNSHSLLRVLFFIGGLFTWAWLTVVPSHESWVLSKIQIFTLTFIHNFRCDYVSTLRNSCSLLLHRRACSYGRGSATWVMCIKVCVYVICVRVCAYVCVFCVCMCCILIHVCRCILLSGTMNRIMLPSQYSE